MKLEDLKPGELLLKEENGVPILVYRIESKGKEDKITKIPLLTREGEFMPRVLNLITYTNELGKDRIHSELTNKAVIKGLEHYTNVNLKPKENPEKLNQGIHTKQPEKKKNFGVYDLQCTNNIMVTEQYGRPEVLYYGEGAGLNSIPLKKENGEYNEEALDLIRKADSKKQDIIFSGLSEDMGQGIIEKTKAKVKIITNQNNVSKTPVENISSEPLMLEDKNLTKEKTLNHATRSMGLNDMFSDIPTPQEPMMIEDKSLEQNSSTIDSESTSNAHNSMTAEEQTQAIEELIQTAKRRAQEPLMLEDKNLTKEKTLNHATRSMGLNDMFSDIPTPQGPLMIEDKSLGQNSSTIDNENASNIYDSMATERMVQEPLMLEDKNLTKEKALNHATRGMGLNDMFSDIPTSQEPLMLEDKRAKNEKPTLNITGRYNENGELTTPMLGLVYPSEEENYNAPYVPLYVENNVYSDDAFDYISRVLEENNMTFSEAMEQKVITWINDKEIEKEVDYLYFIFSPDEIVSLKIEGTAEEKNSKLNIKYKNGKVAKMSLLDENNKINPTVESYINQILKDRNMSYEDAIKKGFIEFANQNTTKKADKKVTKIIAYNFSENYNIENIDAKTSQDPTFLKTTRKVTQACVFYQDGSFKNILIEQAEKNPTGSNNVYRFEDDIREEIEKFVGKKLSFDEAIEQGIVSKVTGKEFESNFSKYIAESGTKKEPTEKLSLKEKIEKKLKSIGHRIKLGIEMITNSNARTNAICKLVNESKLGTMKKREKKSLTEKFKLVKESKIGKIKDMTSSFAKNKWENIKDHSKVASVAAILGATSLVVAIAGLNAKSQENIFAAGYSDTIGNIDDIPNDMNISIDELLKNQQNGSDTLNYNEEKNNEAQETNTSQEENEAKQVASTSEVTVTPVEPEKDTSTSIDIVPVIPQVENPVKNPVEKPIPPSIEVSEEVDEQKEEDKALEESAEIKENEEKQEEQNKEQLEEEVEENSDSYEENLEDANNKDQINEGDLDNSTEFDEDMSDENGNLEDFVEDITTDDTGINEELPDLNLEENFDNDQTSNDENSNLENDTESIEYAEEGEYNITEEEISVETLADQLLQTMEDTTAYKEPIPAKTR